MIAFESVSLRLVTREVPGGGPVRSGYVASIARPGGNATGFAVLENAIDGKWVEAQFPTTYELVVNRRLQRRSA